MSPSVLHVDDEQGFAEIVKTFLEQDIENLEYHYAENPREGLAMLDSTPIECIVSDYDMPEQNGIEFLKAVRETHPDLPFILYTGKGSEEIASDAISAGVTDYLQKAGGSSQFTILMNRIRNVVEQYRTKRLAAENQQRLRHFFEQSPLGAIEMNEQLEIVRINEKAADILGYTTVELVGEPWHTIVPAGEQAPVESLLQEMLEDGDGRHSINQNVRKDGSYIYCEWHNRIIEETGYPTSVFAKFRDITDRIEREQELELKNRAMNEAPVGISITDPQQDDNPLVYVNSNFTELTGYSTEESLGQNCRFLQGEATNDEARKAMREAIADGEEVTVEILNYRKDSTEFWNRVTIAPVRDESGEIVNFVGFQQDVTAQKRQTIELETVIQNLPGYVYRHDYSPEFSLHYVKGDAESVTGYSASELENEIVSAESVIHPDDNHVLWNSMTSTIEDSGEFDTRYRIIRKDGETRWVRDQGSLVVDPVDGREYIDGFVTDITELREREDRLEQFASLVSHDLRNPLSVASGRLELARNERDSEHLDAIQDAHQRMESLIDDLLEIARHGSGPAGFEETELGPIVMSSWSNVETGNATLESVDGVTLRCDPNRFKQLLENCFRNAVEHGGDDVTVSVEILPNGIAIEDDGAGIDEATLDNIFEPGYSSHSAGTGFGLSIVEKIVIDHGWNIHACASERGGARFEITGMEIIEQPDP